MKTIKTDIAVIGAGPGGYVAAIYAAKKGKKVVIIEKNKLGGVCLNIGCIPSKALIHQAEIYKNTVEAEKMGIKSDFSTFSYEKVHKKSREVSEKLSTGIAYLLKKNGVQVISGTAVISKNKTVIVESGKDDNICIEAQNVIIATGSNPRILTGFEYDGKLVLSSNDALMLNERPKKMIILGGGVIGCEFAHIMNTFGVEVVIIEMLSQLLPNEDPASSSVLTASFKKRNISIHTNTKANKLTKKTATVELEIEDQQGKKSVISADKILVVPGRDPNTSGIGLENLGIETERGFIPVGDYYETKVKGVYAIGDVVATPLLAHVASKEGEIAVNHIIGVNTEKRVKADEIPSAVYTEPEVASFGITLSKAKDKGISAKEVQFPYSAIGKAVATESTEGAVKIVLNLETQEILGAHIVGSKATEIVHEILLAKKAELIPEDIAEMIHAHPSFSEAIMESAKMVHGEEIHI